MSELKVQVAPYDYPVVHIQLRSNGAANPKDLTPLFTKSNQRNYGAAFDVEDEELWNAVNAAKKTLPSLYGSSRMYAPATLVRDDMNTLRITLTTRVERVVIEEQTKSFAVEHTVTPIILPIA